jgi:hypothetical protein
MDVSRHILVLDTSVFLKGNMDRREYFDFDWGVGEFQFH